MSDIRTRTRAGHASPLLVALALLGCAPMAPRPRASSANLAPPPSFPSQADLAQITAAPVPARLFDDKATDVPTWDLVGPLPEAIEQKPHEDSSTWGKLLTDAAAAHAGTVTAPESMHCVAREHAAFYLDNESMPAEPLQRFIAARCGVPTSHFSTGYQALKFDERTTEAKVTEALREPSAKMLESLLETGNQTAGLAFGRKKGRAVVFMVSQRQRVRLETTLFAPGPDGKVLVRGEVLEQAASVRGLINRGRYGYAKCAVDLRVRLPRFALECPALREDEAAWIEIAAFPPGRVLGNNVLELMVWPSGAPGKTYARLARSSAAPSPAGPIPAAAVVEGLNRVRKDAGLGLLTVAERESKTADRLAPHYFAALSGGAPGAVAEQVALGLRAGWEVEGMVRNGTFVSTWIKGAKDATDVLGSALARPFGREALLDPTAERVAIGTVFDPKDGVQAAVLSAYSLFDGYKHDRDGAKVLARFAALRAARGLLAAVPMPELDALALRAAQLVQVGARSPDEALEGMLQAAAMGMGGHVIGGVSEATTLEDMIFPEQLLAQPTVRLAVGVAHHKPAGHPWGRFIIYYVTVAQPAGMTARRQGPSGG